MESVDLVVRAQRAIVDGEERPTSVGIRDGSITVVGPLGLPAAADRTLELGEDVVLLPGLVDSHVHVCEPGTSWEGFATATRAAAAGGITTLVDMPLDSVPVTTTVAALEAKRAAARGRSLVDVGFWGGVVPGNAADLVPLYEAGVLGFKCFLGDSGSDDFPAVDLAELRAAMTVLSDLEAPLLVHAEAHPQPAEGVAQSRRYAAYLISRPRRLEDEAIADVIEAARETGARVHIVHVSSSDALSQIRSARGAGIELTAETCPHYLTLCSEEIPDGATTFKCSPPIREAANRERLWEGLRANVLDAVVSDHSPCTIEMKMLDKGDFSSAWGGISSLQLSLAVTWSAARERGFSLVDIARWMAEGPARIAGLPRKGEITQGFDADLVVFAPDERFVVTAAALHHRHPLTPYVGRELSGVVRTTLLDGNRIDPSSPRGRLVAREAR